MLVLSSFSVDERQPPSCICNMDCEASENYDELKSLEPQEIASKFSTVQFGQYFQFWLINLFY